MALRVAVGLAAALVFAGGAAARCPPQPLPLPADLAEAARATLRFAVRSYAPRAGVVATRGHVARLRALPDWAPGAFVRSACGRTAWERTLAVTVVFPVMYDDANPRLPGCDYCAGAIFLVSRTERGWRVWDALTLT